MQMPEGSKNPIMTESQLEKFVAKEQPMNGAWRRALESQARKREDEAA